MANLTKQRRLAAQLLNVGENRVWLDPGATERIEKAITREDLRVLIEEGVIKAEPIRGISRGRARFRARQRALGRRKGPGSREGAKGARRGKKEVWIRKVRALRRRLRELRDQGAINRITYRELYIKARGGEFRTLNHLNEYLTHSGILKEEGIK